MPHMVVFNLSILKHDDQFTMLTSHAEWPWQNLFEDKSAGVQEALRGDQSFEKADGKIDGAQRIPFQDLSNAIKKYA